MSRVHLAPVDGLRAIATLSLIASHTLTITSSLFPSSGPQWEALVSHPLFIFMSGGGGVHTDVFLVVGGLLLGLQARASWSSSAAAAAAAAPRQSLLAETASGALRRAVRLWPTLLANSLFGFGVLRDSVAPKHVPLVVLATLSFLGNYVPARVGGSYTSSPAWSVGVAFQCGVAASALLLLLRRALPARTLLASRALFLALFLASFAVRAALFDEKEFSLVRLGGSRHFAYYQTGHALAWVERQFPPFRWRAEGLDAAAYGVFAVPGSAKAAYALRYFCRMYFVTHARFGPFALGVLLGLCLPEQQQGRAAAASRSSGAWWWGRRLLMGQFTLSAAGTLASTMLPPLPSADEAPLAAHAISTIGLHNMTAMAITWLLFTVLCPEGSPWHNGPLRRALSWRELRPIARHSYSLNMVHFRIIFELTFRLAQRTADPPGTFRCVPHVLGLYVCGTAASYALALAFDELLEPRLRAAVARATAAALGAVGVKWSWEDLAGVKKPPADAASKKKVT